MKMLIQEVLLLEKYRYSEEEQNFLENSPIPFGVYQFINKRVVTVALSRGFIEMAGYSDMTREEVYDLMNNNMYQDTHPDDLSVINDTLGHEAGDKCICEACNIICRVFKRSPVYRVGGDEFVVISQDEDYEHTEELVDVIAGHNEEARINGGIMIACGMAKFEDDADVVSVFNRADKQMYENKKFLKEKKKGKQ